jgi:hypothetical protein
MPVVAQLTSRPVASRWRRAVGLTSCIAVVVSAVSMVLLAPGAAAASGDSPLPTTPYGGFNPGALTRAAYVTDLTSTSAEITWATNSSLSALGSVRWHQHREGTAPPRSPPGRLPRPSPPPRVCLLR